MATMQEEIQKYKAQTQQYDAGRPTTPSGGRPGLKISQPQQSPQFQPAESRGMAMPGKSISPEQAGGSVTPMTRQQISTSANPAGMVDPNQKTVWPDAGKAIAQGARAALRGSEWQDGAPSAPRSAMPIGQAQAATPTAAPVISPDQKVFDDVQREVADVRAKSALNASAAGVDTRNLPSREQVRSMILERGGMKNEVPVTARPGNVLSVTQATQRKPLAYNGVFEGGGPEVRAQEALHRKQMEVMAAERADKTLLTAPGSRDYISPTLTEEQMRARQAEIATQRKQDGEDVAAQQVNNATIKSLDDQAKGITSDRNLGMLPYAERRAAINNRDGLMNLNASMQQKRIDDAAKAADRTAGNERAQMEDSTKRAEIDAKVGLEGQKLTSEEKRAMMADSTTRRGQDIGLESSMSQAEAQARERALDRENQRAVAQLRQSQPIDRVKIEGIKAYNKYITDKLTLSPELRNDPKFFTDAMGIYNLTPEDLRSQMMTGGNPYYESDDEI